MFGIQRARDKLNVLISDYNQLVWKPLEISLAEKCCSDAWHLADWDFAGGVWYFLGRPTASPIGAPVFLCGVFGNSGGIWPHGIKTRRGCNRAARSSANKPIAAAH